MIDFTRVNWPLVGLAVGTFWGIYAFFVSTPHPLRWKKKKDYPTPLKKWQIPLDVGWSIVVLAFQFFFNFVSGFAGCIGLGLFFERYSNGHLGWPEIVLVVVALAGVMGKLAEVIFIIPDLLKKLVDMLAKKLLKP